MLRIKVKYNSYLKVRIKKIVKYKKEKQKNLVVRKIKSNQ